MVKHFSAPQRLLHLRHRSQYFRRGGSLCGDGKFKERRIGQIFGLVIGIVAIVGGVVAALNGAEWPGGLIGTGGVATLVAVFVYGKRSREKSK